MKNALKQYAVAFVHYHLNGGGVTRVIEQQALALERLGIPYCVFCGENTAATQIKHSLIPSLFFASAPPSTNPKNDAKNIRNQAKILQAQLEQQAQSLFPKKQIIWHFHNHSIGLNPYYGDLVHLLIKRWHCVLQLHDFIEDGRENNKKNVPDMAKLYPKANHVQYLSINTRDQDLLKTAGANAKQLNNSFIAHKVPQVTPQKLVFYPVQALRRKNIGELLLLALCFPKNYTFAVAQTPTNTTEIAQFWQKIAQDLSLNILFNVCGLVAPCKGAKTDIATWYAHASHIVTTSVQEGFGMAFLEPYYYKKNLLGRNLPAITADLEAKGLNYSTLYHQLLIPKDWLKKLTNDKKNKHAIQANHPFISSVNIEGKPHIDFSNLPEQTQAQLLYFLYEHPAKKNECLAISPNNCQPLPSYLKQVGKQGLKKEEKEEKKEKEEKEEKKEVSLAPWNTEHLMLNLTTVYNQLSMEKVQPNSTTLDFAKIEAFFASQPKHFLKQGLFSP